MLFYAGIALRPSAALMLRIAIRESVWRLGAWIVVVGNVPWVRGSIALLIELSPMALGYAFVIAQAAVVALLAELEYSGLKCGSARRQRGGRPHPTRVANGSNSGIRYHSI